uniref:ABC transporter domain-containing protein n=1 Tax=Manihot esculenta TaxID=3983 RepID=A0A2C9W1A2_MANES
MEGAEIYIPGGSLRRGDSSIWSSNAMEGFSKSSREEDDEEALKWAALERLPTYDRLKKGILATSKGASEIDIHGLGFHERKALIDRLVKVADQDNERFLLKLKDRIDRVGIEFPTLEVRFEHLTVETEAHVGSRALPSFLNFFVDTVEGLLNNLHMLPSRKKRFSILEDISGIIRPTRMTLLLGPPSSGKTTLLLALAGKLDPKLKLSGSVTYNGHGMNEFVPRRTAAYISQHDTHIGEMTVRETLAFSARCQGVGHRYEVLTELLRREKQSNIKPDPDVDVFMKGIAAEGQETNVITDYILKILGLDVCADIMVGNEMLRGVSGGQRKRVTTGEMLVGPAKALFMDEISTGLDSSTTFQIVNSIKQFIRFLNGTAVISLLQPAPETYDLFDDIILLSDGHIVYQGPREHVLEFFEHMGFRCPERKGVADFLQEVTSRKDQQQYWACKDSPYSFITVKEFAEAFQSFHVGQRLKDELSTPFDKAKNHPAALATKKYGVGNIQLLKACFSRELLLMKRNSFVHVFKLTQLTIMAMVAMTLFFRTEMHRDSITDGGIYSGSLFFSVIFIMFNGLSEMSMTISKLPVFYKQRNLLFYPAWVYSLPPWITKIPITLVQVALWVFITYYVIGYDPSAGRLFRQYFLLVLISQMASALFRFIAAAGRNMIVAHTFGAFALVLLFALGGFVLSRDDIKKWWIWGYWISPLMYGQNAIVVNEFFGKSWSHVLPNSTEPLGVQVLKSRGFFPHAYWYWIGVGALVGFTLLYNFCFIIALTFLEPLQKPQAVLSEDTPSNEPGRTAGAIQLLSQDSSHKTPTDSGRGSSFRISSERTEVTIEGNRERKKGMVLPFEPHSITFNDVKYSVDMPQEMKNQGATEDKLELLRGVSGAFRPGVLTALMGSSGAGKTTLMDVLSGRKTGGYIEGNIKISGYPKKQETFARISGYCEQNDIHSPHVTVYESLLYSAWLRLPAEVSSETRKMFIEEVMQLVELTSLRQALVGLPGVSGLSTEQRKRLTIAVELVANPSLIFMDEPTSGLDARAAAIVMRAYSQAFLVQCMACLWKQCWSYWRNPAYTAVRLLFTTVIALTFGTMFWDLGSKTTKRQDLLNAMGSMYAAIVFLGIQNASSVQPVVAVERTVFYRERAAGMYSPLAYAFAQVVIELPYIFSQAVVYGLIVYAMIGFEWTAAKFFWYLFFMYFTLLYYTFYGMMSVAVTPNQHVASIVSSAFYSLWNLFSGFIIPRPRMPVWWRWYSWACPVAYTLYGLVSSQFGDIKHTLESGDSVEEFVRSYFDFKHELLGAIAAAVVGFAALFAFTFAVCIKFFNFQRR